MDQIHEALEIAVAKLDLINAYVARVDHEIPVMTGLYFSLDAVSQDIQSTMRKIVEIQNGL